MRRQSFRARPLDPKKPIKVVKSVSGITFEDENGNKRHVAADSHGTTEKKIITYNIPIPVIKTVPGYEQQVKDDFVLQSAYIRHKRDRESDLQRETLYNLVHEDKEWLRNNPLIGPSGTIARITPEVLEEMLDVFAKENQLRSRSKTNTRATLTQADAEEILLTRLRLVGPASAKVAAEVRSYWESKMRKLKKSLLRMYWPKTSESDNNPHHTFRAMENANVPNLRPFRRHKGMEAFLFMETLRNDLVTTRNLLEKVKQRETIKRRILLHHRELLEQSVYDITATAEMAKAVKAAMAKAAAAAAGPRILAGAPWSPRPSSASASSMQGAHTTQAPSSATVATKNASGDGAATAAAATSTSTGTPTAVLSSSNVSTSIKESSSAETVPNGIAASSKKPGDSSVVSGVNTSAPAAPFKPPTAWKPTPAPILAIIEPSIQRPLGIELRKPTLKPPRFRLKLSVLKDSGPGGSGGVGDGGRSPSTQGSHGKQAVALATPLVPSFLFDTAFPGSRSAAQHTLPPSISTWPPQIPVVDYGGVVATVDDDDVEALPPGERKRLDASAHPLAGTQRTFVCRGRIGRGGRYVVDRIPCRKKLSGADLADIHGAPYAPRAPTRTANGPSTTNRTSRSISAAAAAATAARNAGAMPRHLQRQRRKRGRPMYARPPFPVTVSKPVRSQNYAQCQ